MEIKTKFSNGDKVYTLSRQYIQQTITCPCCEGEGKLIGKNNHAYTCPECCGRTVVYSGHKNSWSVVGPYTIGQVRVEITGESEGACPGGIFDNYGSQKYEYIEQYMLEETGIKSGTLHYVDLLYATFEEAQEACDKRNQEGE
jgi:DnaJ-class molecular chaperone